MRVMFKYREIAFCEHEGMFSVVGENGTLIACCKNPLLVWVVYEAMIDRRMRRRIAAYCGGNGRDTLTGELLSGEAEEAYIDHDYQEGADE